MNAWFSPQEWLTVHDPPAPRQNKNSHILHSFSHLKPPFGCMIQMDPSSLEISHYSLRFVCWVDGKKHVPPPKWWFFTVMRKMGIEFRIRKKSPTKTNPSWYIKRDVCVFSILKMSPPSKSVQPRVVYYGHSPKKGWPPKIHVIHIHLPTLLGGSSQLVSS